MADHTVPPGGIRAVPLTTAGPARSAADGAALLVAPDHPATMVLRWAAVGFGVVALAPANTDVGWTDVALLAVCVFLTTLRTIMPLELGRTDRLAVAAPLVDVAVFALAVGWTGATESPWLLCLLVAVGIAAYGWGSRMALLAGSTAVVTCTVVMQLTGAAFAERFDDTGDLLATTGMALAAAGGLYLRSRALEAQRILLRTDGELARLGAANALLQQLTEVALTLPGAFTLREVLESTRSLLRTHVDPRTIVLVTPDGERSMNTYLGVTEHLAPSDIDEAMMENAEWIFLEGYRFDGPESHEAFAKAIAAVKRGGGRVALTLSDPFCIERHRDAFAAMLKADVDLLFANQSELLSMYDTDDLDTALAAASAEVETVVCTAHEHGAHVVRGPMRFHCPAVPTKVVDATGAGDLFAGAFLWGLVEDFDLETCGMMGNIAASEVISHIGARPETDLKARFRDFGLKV